MGDPKKSRRQWQGPRHPWKKDSLIKELSLLGKYGLRNKRELWIANSTLKSYRNQASAILALEESIRVEREKTLIKKLTQQGLLTEEAVLDNVLGLNVDDILERRLQTIVLKLRMAATPYQARQFIVHGHVNVGGRRMTSPGYLVSRDEELNIRCAINLTTAPEQAAVKGA